MKSTRTILQCGRALFRAQTTPKNYLCTASVLRSNENVVKSPFPDVNIPNVPLDEYIWKDLSAYGDKTAVVCGETDRSYSYETVRKQCSRIAQAIRAGLGLSRGDVLAVFMPNIPEYCATVLGAVESGVVVTTINPVYIPEEIARQLVHSGAKAIVTLCLMHPVVEAARKLLPEDMRDMPIVTVRHLPNDITPQGAVDWKSLAEWNGSHVSLGSSKPSDLAFLPYSSGTTGLPKGVELTHQNIVANIQQFRYKDIKLNAPTTPDHQDSISAILPMYHIYGLVLVFLNGIAERCRLVTLTRFKPQTYIAMLDRYKPAVLYTAPPLIHFLVEHPSVTKLDYVRAVICGAAPLADTDITRFNIKFKVNKGRSKIVQGYGLTEAAPLTHSQRIALDTSCGGIGWAIPNTECRIISLDDDKTNLGPGETGQLAVRGPQVMKGYYNDPEATRNTVDSEGWLRTGDIGYYDRDNQFFITDRLKELIKVKGFQVAPAELEAILRDHPDVMDAAVTGIPDPDLGQAPKAFVVSRPTNTSLTEKCLQDYVAGKVAPFKKLVGGVVFVKQIPRNPSGKILRRELQNM